jgi:hypothetical protein
MDDSFELIIYIIFIALSLVGGLYKNYAKKKAEQSKRQSPPPAFDDTDIQDYNTEPQDEYKPSPRINPFEEFIRQQLEETKPEPKPIQKVVEEPKIPENKYQSASSKLDVILNEGNASFQNTAKELVSDNMFEPDFSISDPFAQESSPITDMIFQEEIGNRKNAIDDFDLKKAIIYSEIINRPNH